MDDESIFTKIIRGDVSCHKVFEDDEYIAILDISPEVYGHTLLIPKIQIDQFDNLPDEYYARLWEDVRMLCERMKKTLNADRIRLVIDGKDIPNHAHIHLLPFWTNTPPEYILPSEITNDLLKEVAERLQF
jgi:histidine triad (HIT) family protein